jgi:putative ABC transport system permease protein
MRLPDLFHIASRNLMVNKRRTLLTMLGLIIGVMSVLLVTSLGAGAQHIITGQIERRGTNQIAILPGASEENGPPASALGIVITTLLDEDREALLRDTSLVHLQEAASYVSGNDVLQAGSDERSVTYQGVTASYVDVEQVRIAQGRFFDEDEAERGAAVMVLGATRAEELFPNNSAIGERVKLGRHRFQIVGVLQEKGSSGFENTDDAILVPLAMAQDRLLGIEHVHLIRAVVDGEEYVEQTVEQIRDVLRERHDDEDFSLRNTADLLDILTQITDAIRFFLIGVAGVALFVGGVGIMNIMLIAVQEKTREIGLRKAIGATTRDIMFQFLFETMLMSCLGGLIGIVLGSGISYVIARIVQALGYDYAFIISPTAVLSGLLISTLIGLVFGLRPARIAASLDPIDAMRYE